MCGINGYISTRNPVDIDLFIAARDSMKHRGPDGCGLYVSENKLAALGHRRLSLLDLSDAGRQPMANEDKTIWLTYNGEIYNYAEIRQELIACGHRFTSNTDSEIIIHGYEEWGIDTLHRFMGMFAFALWDSKEKKLFMARDRFGVKPIYYYTGRDSFRFASEIKGIITDKNVPRELDYSSVCDFFVYRYVPSPKTIFKNIHKLPPATYLELDKDLNIKIKTYWNLESQNKDIPENEAVEAVDFLLRDSIKKHIISDVPVGSFLSGGYDSSALVDYICRNNYSPRTFAIGFENWDKSEHQYAELVAERFNTDHKSTIIGSESLNLVEHLSFSYDEPIADISIVPTYIISKMASKDVKAVVSGEGADEMFCGYTWQRDYNNYFKKQNFLNRFLNRFNLSSKSFAINEYSNAMAMGKFEPVILRQLLNRDLAPQIPKETDWFYDQHYKRNIGHVKSFQYMDVKCFMAELVLTKIDRATMANSLEARVPFLDHKLMEYIFSIKEKIYYKPEITKYLLHENIKNSFPEKILKRKKQGFVGPDIYYMDINWYQRHLKNGTLVKEQIIQKDKLLNLIQNEDHWRLWKLIVFQFWYDRWMLENL
jgi:asparagine synthase (glutamine-hydrolysing)